MKVRYSRGMAVSRTTKQTRNLVVVLGDQLDPESAAFDGFDPAVDRVWMAETCGESERVWSSKPRILMFLAAMRHFREEVLRRNWPLEYTGLDDGGEPTLARQLASDVQRFRPERIVLLQPGNWQVEQEIKATIDQSGCAADMRRDRHFLCTHERFAEYANARKQLRQEYFYRWMRKQHHVLMEQEKPAGGQWNFDKNNRQTFGKNGPGKVPSPLSFSPDEITRDAAKAVERHFPDHPGTLANFAFPVTTEQAREALHDFVENRLAAFGDVEDAMWTGYPFLYHALLSASMNLHLLNPKEVIDRVEEAWREDRVPLNAAEGFIRQVLGWREYVRGIYWHFMPDYADRNALDAEAALPDFYWTGETDMVCLRECIGQTLAHGYAHHIQRLMVTGLFALLTGVRPRAVHEWYLAVYVDAVEWVELPNTLGMSQFADGGIMASKPYVATGKYIRRMSNYCATCRYDPNKACGKNACPFTTLYWDFLMRHEAALRQNPRMNLQLRNLDRKDDAEKTEIRNQAQQIQKS